MKIISIYFAYALLSFSSHAMDFLPNLGLGVTYHALSLQHLNGLTDAYGTNIAPHTLNEYFYNLPYASLPELSQTMRELYLFLERNDLIRTVGTVYLKKLLEERRLTKDRLELKKYIQSQIDPRSQVSDLSVMQWVLNKGNATGVFHQFEKGIFFRSKETHQKGRNKSTLLVHDGEAQRLIKSVNRVNHIIKEKLLSLQRFLDLNKNRPAPELFKEILEHENLPRLVAAKLKYILETEDVSNEAVLITIIDKRLKEDIGIIEERILGLSKIYPAKLDMMLLYCFYLFDEETRTITERLEKLAEKKFSLSILASYPEDDALSASELLAPYAQNVLEELGFFAIQAPEIQTSNVEKARTNAGPSKKKVRKKATQRQQPVKKKCIENEITIESSLSVAVKDSEVYVETTCLDITTDDNLNRWLYATNNSKDLDVKLKLSKGHRLLDTVARLMSRELVSLKAPAGSLSVAIITASDGSDKLIVSTKKNVPEWIVLRAMKNLYNNSSKLFNACENKGIYIKDLKTLIEQELGYEETKKYRNKIDKIKFMKSLSNEHPSTELEIRFKNLFASGYENLNLVILGNPFNFHSEINLANFLIDGVKKLGAISTNEGDVAYQYIGGSILNCGGCSALFKGCKNIAGINERVSTYKILIFSRGNYNCRYPNFSLPKWAININQSRGKIYWALDECMMRTKDISNEEISILQQAELSDSDDDNLNI